MRLIHFLFLNILFYATFATQAQISEQAINIDEQATTNAPWETGEKTIENDNCRFTQDLCYTVFLGITTDGYMLIQDYFASGAKHSDPYRVSASNIAVVGDYETGEIVREEPTGYTAELNIHDRMAYFGVVNFYYQNGQIGLHGQYAPLGEEAGIWLHWDSEGNLLEEKDYGDNK